MSMKQTFWRLLDSYTIEIPIIQRDYAQGRANVKAEQIRKGFVESLHQMVINPNLGQDLDFIYGATKGNTLILLDGQQRLTTLFLLHWYIATDTKLGAQAGNRLSKFHYETRISSREFIHGLLKFRAEIDLCSIDGSLSSEIKDAHWFFSVWENDPTVQSMLTMLDEIHVRFRPSLDNGIDIWQQLVCEDKPPITFHFLNMDDFSLTDELYIKMNARGKALTEFENFKAWLQNYAKLNDDFWQRMDKQWTDVFWQLRKENTYEIDNEFLRFFKSVGLANSVKTMTIPANNAGKLSKADGSLVDLLRGDDYVPVQTYIDQNCFDDDTLKSLGRFLNFVYENIPLNDKKGTSLEYCKVILKDVLSNNGYLEQVRFYSLFTFVINVPAVRCWDTDLFEQLEDWISISLKLINNTSYDSSADYMSAINSLTSLRKLLCWDVYQKLSLTDAKDIKFFNEQQCEEEITKAKLIIENFEWKERLKKYESHYYFYGQVGFLLDAAEIENTGQYDIDQFTHLAEKMKNIFSKNILDSDDFILQRALLSVGDYLISVGYSGNYGFCRNVNSNARDRNENWRKVFNDKDKRKAMLFQLLDRLEIGKELSGLHDVITNRNTNDWREFFIRDPRLIAACGKRLARFYHGNTGEIYLLNGVKKATRDKGLRTYALYLAIKDSLEPCRKGLQDKMQSYWKQSSEEELPTVCFSDWQKGTLLIEYNNGYQFKLIVDGKEDTDIDDCDDFRLLQEIVKDFDLIEDKEEL